ncbi:ELMO domain-containing protein 3 [Clonorchis sinensis]|uniref:ELMO domain-containing protein 3 n=1 Tax=Clonorchis sinensis TaxID=79923 RepID=A0A419Q0B3_CLOSI|nr:ELMO domain-containing protein 3 [Clonorchis sinensis]
MDVTLKVASEDCDKAQAVQLAEKPRIQRISPVRLLLPPPWPALSPSTELSTTSFGDTQAETVSPGLPEIADLKSKRDGTSIVSSEISFSQCLEQMNFPVKPTTTPPLAPRRMWKRFRPLGWFRKRPNLKPNLLDEREFVYATVYTECQPFEDSLHGQMLYTIFKRFTGSPACLTKGDHWQLIGFQGSDPTTDFRGAGLLALLCLVYFATEPPFCNTVPSLFRQSLEPKNNALETEEVKHSQQPFRLQVKKLFSCSTLWVPSCHAKHEGWDTARLPKPRQGKSRGRGRIRSTDLPVSKLAPQPLSHPAHRLQFSNFDHVLTDWTRFCRLTDNMTWLTRKLTDRKFHGSNQTSASRLPPSRLGQPDSSPALMFLSGGMVAMHRKGSISQVPGA